MGRLLGDMFGTLAGWLMFLLGVILAGTVKSLWSRTTGGMTATARTTRPAGA
jgi:hypothetical protein